MKLSNKILLWFFGFIFLYLSAAFTELRLTGSPNVISDKNTIAETVDISGVRYLILNDAEKNINVKASDSARLEVRSFSGGLLEKLKYEVSGDTLTLSGLKSEFNKPVRISVLFPKNVLKAIIVNRSVATIDGLGQDLLNISQNSGRVWMTRSRIAKIEMDVSNQSHLDISGTNLDTLVAKIARSQVYISSPVGLLQGSVENASHLQMSDLREIQLKKDKSSSLNLY